MQQIPISQRVTKNEMEAKMDGLKNSLKLYMESFKDGLKLDIEAKMD